MRASDEEEGLSNRFPERKCSVRIALGNLTDVDCAKIFRDCGFDPASDFRCIQKVSAGAYVFVFRSCVKKEKCLDLVDRFAMANMHIKESGSLSRFCALRAARLSS